MDFASIHSVYTVLMLVIFVGIWIWAWSGRRKKRFHDAANLPFADEEQNQRSLLKTQEKENRHE
jgi:cytochrome c oxidase cbb3-type subunit 4